MHHAGHMVTVFFILAFIDWLQLLVIHTVDRWGFNTSGRVFNYAPNLTLKYMKHLAMFAQISLVVTARKVADWMITFIWSTCVKFQWSFFFLLLLSASSFLPRLLYDTKHLVITYWLFNYQYLTAHLGSRVSFNRPAAFISPLSNLKHSL